jgi:hypothetical protein
MECLNNMPRDRAKEVSNQAASTMLNINRQFYCDCISKGVAVPGVPVDEQGYLTISYHMAGTRPAWVMQARLRKRYPMLDTKVVNVTDLPVKHNAEVRVKLREEAKES